MQSIAPDLPTKSSWLAIAGTRRNVYAACDMIVIASLRTEASPIVLREAFASGRPVIATKVGDIPEIVRHRENGLLIEPGNTQALASAILEFISIRNWRRIAQRTASATRPKIFRSTK
jgi:glycosyltransferase involved in cell wall biosynthesis